MSLPSICGAGALAREALPQDGSQARGWPNAKVSVSLRTEI